MLTHSFLQSTRVFAEVIENKFFLFQQIFVFKPKIPPLKEKPIIVVDQQSKYRLGLSFI